LDESILSQKYGKYNKKHYIFKKNTEK